MRYLAVASLAVPMTLPYGSTAAIHAQSSQVETAVTKLAADWWAAWNAHDLDRVMALYDTPKGWFMWGGRAIPSTDSLRAAYKALLDNRTADDFKWSSTQVTVVGPNAAFFQGIYDGRASYKDGRVLEWNGTGLISFLVERRGSAWKITAMHLSAGPGAPVPK